MTLTIGADAPDFEALTTKGAIRFHDWINGKWCLLFSHPKDFTPVCTTELGAMAHAAPEFERRGVRLIGLSVDPHTSHMKWLDDIETSQGIAPNYPIIADPSLTVAKLYGMLPADTEGDAQGRTAMDNATARCVFIIGPDRKIKLTMTYPMTTGRSVAELLRVVDSLQLTARQQLATPANWQQGDKVVIASSVSDKEAHARFPGGWEAPVPYLRLVEIPA